MVAEAVSGQSTPKDAIARAEQRAPILQRVMQAHGPSERRLLGRWWRWRHSQIVMRPGFHLAQVNIARMRAPLDAPLLAGFVARLDDMNALADAAPGFVWRLQTDAGDATALRPYDDERILFNLSVWETPEHLRHFVYHSIPASRAAGRSRQSLMEELQVLLSRIVKRIMKLPTRMIRTLSPRAA